jgi:hypothetical protein
VQLVAPVDCMHDVSGGTKTTTILPGRHAAGERGGWTQFMQSWRRGADEARGDRLVTAFVGLGGAVTGAAVVWLARSSTVAVLVGLVTLCVTPGCAIVCWLSTRERLTRVLAVVATSMTWTILVGAVCVWLQVTTLGIVLMATAGVGGAGSGAFLLAQSARHLRRLASAAQVNDGEDFPGSASARAGSDPELSAPRGSRSRVLLISSLLVGAAALLAISVVEARARAVGSYGLLPLLGLPFLAAAALTVGALVLALRVIRTVWPAAVVALGLLLVEFNATPMMLDPTPLSSWTYKHFGVVDYVAHGGALKDPLDIYQQWPGFFAAAAWLVRLSGRGSLSYSNWAQLFFEILNGVVLFAIARRFSGGRRVVPYVTVLLFETANWEGQFYYSPQTTAFLLALLFQFFLLPLLEPSRLRRWFGRWRWLTSYPPLVLQDKDQADAIGVAARAVGVIALFAAITVTHQLSPYIVFAGVFGLWVLGVLRRPLLLVALAVTIIAYPLLHLPAIDHNQLLTGFSLSNATGNQSLITPTKVQLLAGVLAKTIALGLWCATAVCVLSSRRRLGSLAIPLVLAAAPLSFILVTNYDGEAIYRAFLFSSPWCALIIAMRLADLRRMPMLRLTAVGCWALFAALGSAQAQDFGMYPMLQMPSGEIQASSYFLDHAPVNATLVLGAANFPSRLNGRYVLHDVVQTPNDPSLDQSPEFAGNKLTRTNPKTLAQYVAYVAKGTGYLVIAPSMERYVDYYGVFAPGVLPALVPRLKASPYWQVWYENSDTVIFRAWPQGKPAERTADRRHRRARRDKLTRVGNGNS